MDQDKSELILKFPNPSTLKEVHQFLGHAKFYKFASKIFLRPLNPYVHFYLEKSNLNGLMDVRKLLIL